MMPWRRVFACAVVVTAMSVSGSVGAADKDGRFAIDGAGLATCERYVTAIEKRTTDFFLFAGWLDGYMTGFNRLRDDTFDYTPWQTTAFLTRALKSYCAKHPKAKFLSVVDRLINTLEPDRLRAHSPVVSATSEGRGVIVYESVLRQMRQALQASGHYTGALNGTFDESLREAIKRYQKEKGLPVTGLPDQKTLTALFVR